MPYVVRISPSSVINTIRVLKDESGELLTLAGRAARVQVSGIPEPLGNEVTCAVGEAAAVLARHGTTLGTKAAVLQKKIDTLMEAEKAETAGFAGKALSIGGKGLGFAAWLDKHKGKQLTFAMRLDAYAEFLGTRSGGRSTLLAANAWRSVLVEVQVLNSKSVSELRMSYRHAVMAAIRDVKGGKIDYALVAGWRRTLSARARVPKVHRAAPWLHKVKLVPVLGALADGYIGYKESAGSSTAQKITSGVGNTVLNVSADAVTLSGYSWADLASTPTGHQPSDVVKVQADAETLGGLFRDADALARLHRQILNGKKGKLPKDVWGSWSEEQFVTYYMTGGRGQRS